MNLVNDWVEHSPDLYPGIIDLPASDAMCPCGDRSYQHFHCGCCGRILRRVPWVQCPACGAEAVEPCDFNQRALRRCGACNALVALRRQRMRGTGFPVFYQSIRLVKA